MGMRETWKAAKRAAVTNHAKAYDAWLKAEQKKAGAGDPKARATVLKDALGKSGMAKGFDYTKPMAFNADLGPVLDKIESTHKGVQDAIAKLTLDDLIKKKKVREVWQKYAEGISYTAENYHFLTSGYKLAPEAIYDTYVKRGAKYELNLDSGVQDRWAALVKEKNWRQAKPLIAETRQAIRGLTISDTLPKFKAHAGVGRLLRVELGGKKVPALVDKARKACSVYGRQTQAYGKRWKGIQPDFCTPLNVALDDILGQLDRIRKLYP